MKIAIAMQKEETATVAAQAQRSTASPEYFADFEVPGGTPRAGRPSSSSGEDDTVQVTVVMRGHRDELENPTHGLTQFVLDALRDRADTSSADQVIEVKGIAV